MRVDLHSHSLMSDGTLSPQELSDFMGERGVELFSISDHDTLGAYGKFTPPPGARVIPSIEINTTWRENEVHVLGYNVPLGPSPINELLEYNQAQRRVRAEKMVQKLQDAGYKITFEDVMREAGRGIPPEALGRQARARGVELILDAIINWYPFTLPPRSPAELHHATGALHDLTSAIDALAD